MRLIYVTSSFPFGPGEAFVMPELHGLQAQGHDLLVIPLWPRGKVTHADAARFFPMTVKAPLFSARIGCDFAAAVATNAGVVCRLGRGLGHCASKLLLKDQVVLPKGAWLARVAIAWHADHIHAFWASGAASLALAAAGISGIPWSFTAHRFDIVENKLLVYKAERARFIRFISESGFRMSGLQGTSLAAKARVLHMGVDVNKSSPPVSPPNAPAVALCVANLIPVKDHRTLLETMEELRNRGVALTLWLAGDGELRDALQREVRQRALAHRIKFLGPLSHKTLMDMYASGIISTVVLASANLGEGLHEGIPVSLMEAMSFAIPVVATETGGIPELLGGGAGWMVPPQDPKAFADALHLLIQHPKLRQSLGQAGQQKVQNEFAAPTIARHMAELFYTPAATLSVPANEAR